MIKAPTNVTSTRRPHLLALIHWLAWGFLILLVAGLAIPLRGTIISVAKEGSFSQTLPFRVVFLGGFFCLKALMNPIRGSGDEWSAWKGWFKPVGKPVAAPKE